MIYKVECQSPTCRSTYTQETQGIRDESHKRPYCCGACGSRAIWVWALVYGDIRNLPISVTGEGSKSLDGNDSSL